MEVKCIRTEVNSKWEINNNINDFISVGQYFKVYRIKLDAVPYYLIFDGSHLIEVPSGMFEIVDDALPKNWNVFQKEGVVFIGPLFFNEDFWFDDFSDLSEDERIKRVSEMLV